MKDRGFIFFVIGLLLLSFFLVLQDSFASVFNSKDHCVAYVAKKRLMLIRTVEVVGKNCEIRSQIVPDVDNLYAFKLEIPIDSFESGEEERDKDVKKILKIDQQNALIFLSEKKTKQEWKKVLMETHEVPFSGLLSIANNSYKVKASVNIIKSNDGMEARGKIITKFNDLGLEPPSLFGGIMAKVKEDLELQFILQSEKTLGFSSLLE
ncbi:MAG: hypothetical protein H6625_03005 [Bdellovibrionaceae bacterium]|nr:hypothetical protein [Pseudobdellovibrionaceae bacterium]